MNKGQKFAELFKPIMTYIFLLYIAGLLAVGWSAYQNDIFNTPPLQYLFLTNFFAGMVYLGWGALTFKALNYYDAIARICLLAFIVSDVRSLFFNISLFLFTLGFVVEVLKISFNFDFDDWYTTKIAKGIDKIRGKK